VNPSILVYAPRRPRRPGKGGLRGLRSCQPSSGDAGSMSGHITPRHTGGGCQIRSTPLRPC
jgi:hypothetical protein